MEKRTFSVRKLHLINRAMMAAELGVQDSPRLDEFETLYRQHPLVLKIINRQGEISNSLLSILSLRGVRCWLIAKKSAYLFTDIETLRIWGRQQSFFSGEEEILVRCLQYFLYNFGKRDYEMSSEKYMFHFGGPTRVMGILNVTPDSFFDGDRYSDVRYAVDRGLEMESQGADIIDIGGESTRPGSLPVSESEELARVVPVIEGLVNEVQIPISVDTYKAPVAEAAIQAGATIINDISGLQFDPHMVEVALHYGVPVVVMHIKGTPKDMQINPKYENLMDELFLYFEDRLFAIEQAGIPRERVIIDPGVGFGKRMWDNYEILQRLPELRALGAPILVGPSRKSFIGKALDLPVSERLEGTAAAVAASVLGGTHIVRVHDVREMLRVVQIADLVAGNVILKEEDFSE